MVLQSPVSSCSMYDFQDSAFITSDTDFLGFRLGFRVQGQGLFSWVFGLRAWCSEFGNFSSSQVRFWESLHEGLVCLAFSIPRGSIVVPFWDSYLESYKVTPFWDSYLESYKVTPTMEPLGRGPCPSESLAPRDGWWLHGLRVQVFGFGARLMI